MDLTLIEIFCAFGIVAVGCLVQGSVGFGMGLVSVPFLLLIDTRLVPGSILCAGLTLTILMSVREKSSIDFRGMPWALAGRVVGTVLGIVAMTLIDPSNMRIPLALLVLVAVGISASGVHVEPTRPMVTTAGVASGFMATLSSIGGPPIALVYQHATGERLRATLSGFFVFGILLSLAALAIKGFFGREQLIGAAILVPAAVTGFLLSFKTRAYLDRGYTRLAVLVVSAASSALVIARELIR